MSLFDELRQLHIEKEQNNLVIFVGAGISENYEDTRISRYSLSNSPKIKDGKKFPSWSDLVDEFVPDDMSEKSGIDDLKRVQIYQDLNSKEAVTFKVQELFPREYDCFDIHKLIFDIEPEHVITTNYDHLLEKAMRIKWENKYQVVDCDEAIPFSKSKRNLLVKAHGDICRGNIVLSEKDYNDYEENFPLILSFLKYVFSKYKVLFIGFSLSDPNFNKILYWVKNILNENSIRHTVILHSDITQSERNYFQKRSVDVITSKEISQNFLPDSNESNYLVEALQIIKYGFPSYKYTFEQKTKTFDKNIETFESFNYLLPEHVNNYLSNLNLTFKHDIQAEINKSDNKTKNYPWVANLYEHSFAGMRDSEEKDFNLNTWLSEFDNSKDSMGEREQKFVRKVVKLFLYSNIGVVGMSGFLKHEKQILKYLDSKTQEQYKYLLTYSYKIFNNNESAMFSEIDKSFEKESPHYDMLTLSDDGYFTTYMLGDRERAYDKFKGISSEQDDEVLKYLKYFRLRFLNKNRKITNINGWDQNEGRLYVQIYHNISKFNQNLLSGLHSLNFIQEFISFNIKLEKDYKECLIEKKNTLEGGWGTKDLYQISFYLNYSRFLKFVLLNKLPIVDDQRFQNALRLSNDLYFKYFFIINDENAVQIPNWVIIGILLDNNKKVFQQEIIKLHNQNYTKKINYSFDHGFIQDLILLNLSNKNNESKLLYFENIVYLVSLASENKENFELILNIFFKMIQNDISFFDLHANSLSLAVINYKKDNEFTKNQKNTLVDISNIYIRNVLNNVFDEKVSNKFRTVVYYLEKEKFEDSKNEEIKKIIEGDNLRPNQIRYVFNLLKILGYTKKEINRLVHYLKDYIKKHNVFKNTDFNRERFSIENEILFLYRAYDIDLGIENIINHYSNILELNLSKDSISTATSSALEWMNIFIDDEKFAVKVNDELSKINFNINFLSFIKKLKVKSSFDFMNVEKLNIQESFKLFIKIGKFNGLDQEVIDIFTQIQVFEYIADDINLIEENSKQLKEFFIKSKSFEFANRPLTVSFLALVELFIDGEIKSIKLRPILRGVVEEYMQEK